MFKKSQDFKANTGFWKLKVYVTFSGTVYATVMPSGKSGLGPDAAWSSAAVTSDTSSMPVREQQLHD